MLALTPLSPRIIATILTELVTTRAWIYWSVFFYVFFANALFLVRSLRYVVLPDAASAGVGQTYTAAQRSRRVYFLIIVAACQLPLMWLLVYM